VRTAIVLSPWRLAPTVSAMVKAGLEDEEPLV
jgi:hypothetical protein